MDIFMLMFLFVLPLLSIVLSIYTLIQVLPFKRAVTKLAALGRLSGKDPLDG